MLNHIGFCDLVPPTPAFYLLRFYWRSMKPLRSILVILLCMAFLLPPAGAVSAAPRAVATFPNDSFRGTTATGWTLLNDAILTAESGIDVPGEGWLRLTAQGGAEGRGSAVYNTAFSAEEGVQVSFLYAAYNGGGFGGIGGDGITFFMVDGTTNPIVIGPPGGALGYSWYDANPSNDDLDINDRPGITNGYLGVGIDEFGNFASQNFGRNSPGARTGITVRGPGNELDKEPGDPGYPYITNYPIAAADVLTGNRAGARLVEITITPSPTQRLTVKLDGVTVINSIDISMYPMPSTFKMGFSSSVGGAWATHEVRDIAVTGLDPSQTVLSGSNRIFLGGTATFTASVTCSEETLGKVAFYNGDDLLGEANVSGGSASLSTNTLPLGTQTVSAKYLGNSSCTVSYSNDLSVTVENAAGGPTITSVSPKNGPITGGTPVTITGTNFYDSTLVNFGSGNPATCDAISSTQMVCTTPAHAAGVVDISATNTGFATYYFWSSFTYLAAPITLPATGFPMHRITHLPAQPVEKAYTTYNDLTLEIPKLNVTASIVGVPDSGSTWDVSWLGDKVGYLYGSAFPTWVGNSVLTAHVWDANNTPGIFAHLKELEHGDQFFIYAFGDKYTYEVRESLLVGTDQIHALLKHYEGRSWVTLATCENYNFLRLNYSLRRLVRAVLVSVN